MNRPAAALFRVLTASLVLVPGSASAQGIIEGLSAILDLNVSTVQTTTTTPAGTVETSTNTLYPRLTLNMNTMLYPHLRLNAGGVFEINSSSSTINQLDTDTSIGRMTPFIELRSTNPVFAPGVGFFRRENRTSVAGFPGTRLVNDDAAAYLSWRPEGLPQSQFQFVRTNTFDDRRAFEDETKDFGSVVSRYTYRGLGAYYRGFYLETEDRVYNLETRQVSNSGRLDYSTALLAKRLLWNTTYNISRQDFTTRALGDEGEVALPVNPFAGVAILSDTPLTVTLPQNPLLIDGNLTASAGIDLGLQAPGADTQARNIGLDFLNPTEVNRLWVWVDRDLPVEIANSYSWEIYSSPDNLIWRRETTVTLAPFGPFEFRFEIDFPAITARYLKVVTRPLSPVLPDATRFPDIFVTEVQAFLRQPAGEARGTQQRTNTIFNTDVRFRLLDTPTLYYEGFYMYNRLDPTPGKRDTLSNGLSVNHAFGRHFSLYARGAREQGDQPEGRRVATLTNATFTIDPIPTLRTSLLYAGQDEQIGPLETDRQSFIVQNTAQVYRGVDVIFGFGWNVTNRETGETLHDRLLNVSGTIVPRPNLSIIFTYADTTTKRAGTFEGDPEYRTSRGYLTVAYDPVRTLHLVLGEEVIVGLGQGTRTTHDIGVNWAPFPDGALQFLFSYDEALRSLEFGKERVLRVGARWNLSRRSYIDLTHQRIKSEYVFQTTDTRVLSLDVKLFF